LNQELLIITSFLSYDMIFRYDIDRS